MSTWFQPLPIKPEEAEQWQALTEPNTFRVLPANQIPAALPKNLLDKCSVALVMRSGDAGKEYVVANLYRKDKDDFDQMPFGLSLVAGQNQSGCLTHHGDWTDRTSPAAPAPPEYYKMMSQNGSEALETSFATIVLPRTQTGSIFDLAPKTNVAAFETVLAEVQAMVEAEPPVAEEPAEESTPESKPASA